MQMEQVVSSYFAFFNLLGLYEELSAGSIDDLFLLWEVDVGPNLFKTKWLESLYIKVYS